MKEKIAEKIVTNLVGDLLKEGNKIFDDLYDEGVQFININIKSYLTKYQNKYSYLKTLLHGMTPVYLYDIYHHLSLKSKNNLIETKSISNVFTSANRITIIGDAGGGKSTLVKHLFLNCILEKIGIPILIELRYFNNNDVDLITRIKEEISATNLVVNENILERYLKNGKFVFFLDGYDELKSKVNEKVAKRINSLSKKYDKNKFILTSRPYSNIELLSDFHNFKLTKLSEKEVDSFIMLQLKEEKELGIEIIKSLKENKNKKYIKSFLENPLLLTLYILTFQSNSDIPNKKYIFYRRVVNALFSEHDSKTKLGFKRERKSKLSQEQFEEVLKRFSFLSYFSSKFNFDQEYINSTLKKIEDKIEGLEFEQNLLIEDLLKSIALWIEDGGIYSFAHRSIQEYFATVFISNLNEENKKKIYNKIKSLFNKRTQSELKNLLSLAKEIDEIDFHKFLYIPALVEIQKNLDKKNNSNLENYLTFLFKSITIKKVESEQEEFSISDEAGLYAMGMSRSLQEDIIEENGLFVFNYINKNASSLESYLIKNGIVSHNELNQYGRIKVNIKKLIPFLNKQIMKDKCMEFKNHINNEISRLSLKVENSERSDKDLLSMI